ncbi:MAG: hypothetical protein A2Y75_08680 [Candidatus Solincola sediminis]|uniref:IPT/TIG domain-containing protein n=1 Tax=Candidatus Solincola sediminis TaxID=1797199 RepID=A0A1F2WMY8_9ACTN|nr:MAG: hypothetical protein A2Y75_08680 [Candidatus Solincola sediminis]
MPAGLSTGSQTVTVTAPGGAANTSFTVTEAGEDPMIVSMYPTEGPPGTIVNLVGTGFGLIQIPLLSTVKVSGVTADVDVWSDVLIRFTVPSLAPGDKEVKVSTVLGSTTATFTVTEALPAPVITSLSPDNGPAGSWVAINGSNFGATWQEGCCVLFNSTEIILTTWNENQVMFTVPADASGTASVRVETLSGISNALPFTVTEIPPGPAITSITPDSAAVGTEITLAGSRFGNERGDSKVSIIWWFLPTDLAAGDYVSWSDTEIKFKVPQMSPGEYSVAVTAGGQQSNAMAFDIVEVPLPPGIDYISPGSGTPGTAVTIGGSGFGSSQGTSTLKFGSTDVTPTSWSNNQITCNVPSMAAGTVQVSVTTSLGTDSMDFTVTEPVVLPTITSITPAQGSAGTAVTIDGTNFGNERGDSKVTFVWFLWMGTDIADYTSWSSSQIKFNLPDGMGAGSYSVMVTAGGQQSNSVPFEVIVEVPPVPHIASMSPTTGNPGADVTITGTDFGATQGTSKVSFGSVDVVTYTSWSNTEIKCKAPWQPAGVVQVGVTTAGGISNTAPFTMTTPPPGQLEVTSITPNQGTTLDFSLSVNVQGEGFLEGATIKLDNGTATIEASNIVRVSSTEMTATFGLFMSQPGQYNVTVTNPDSGQATLENAFTVADACGTGSGTALLGFGLMMGLLSISGSGFFRRRLRKNKNK